MTDNFTSKIDFSGDCWTWTGAVNSKGYGCFGVGGKIKLAHRVSYEKYIGTIPDGMQIDHLCRNILCVRPAHLEPVTPAENIRRQWDAHTECGRGHEMTPENTRIHRRNGRPDTKECRTCAIARSQQHRDRRKAA